jgi:PAS domain S-box-containing protein
MHVGAQVAGMGDLARELLSLGVGAEIHRAYDPSAVRALLRKGAWHLILVDANATPDPVGVMMILAQAGLATPVCVVDEGVGLHWIEAGARDCVRPGDTRRIALLASAAARDHEEHQEQRAYYARLRKATQVLLSLSRSDALRGDDLDRGLREITAAAARAAQVARVGVYLHDGDRRCLRCRAMFVLADNRHTSGSELAFADYPDYFAALETDGHIVAHNALTDPRTRAFTASYLGPNGISSMLDTVVTSGGRSVGVICLEHLGPPRRWTLEDEVFASAIADLVSLAIERAERHRAEEARDESERRFREIFDHTSDLITFLDVTPDGHFVARAVNPAVERSTGLTLAEINGKEPHQVLPAAAAEILSSNLARGVAANTTINFLSRVDLTVGRRWYSTVLVPGHDEHGRVTRLAQISRDITEQKHAEEALVELNRDLEQRVRERTADLAAANAELEAFSYTVSHDLRSPLRSISGFSTALLEDHAAQLDDEGRLVLARVVAATRKMNELIEGLLGLSRVTRGELEREAVDLSAMVERAAKREQAQAPDRQVTVTVAPGMTAFADRRLLGVAVDNLVQNAFKYTRGTSHAHIQFDSETRGGERIYRISDDGAGFDPEYKHRLFQPFSRLHRDEEFEGSGIGLATVERIVRRHGGRVWADGAPERGATISFTLAATKTDGEASS